MSLRRVRSIFFKNDVRLGKPMGGAGVTRISVVEDKRYHVYVEVGIEAQIHDVQLGHVHHIAWDCVRDWDYPDGVEKAIVPEVETSPESPKAKQQSAGAPRTLA